MPIDQELLDILCCPKTKVPVEMLSAELLAKINAAISAGGVTHVDGSHVEQPLAEGLMTEDRKTVYRIDDGIPIMLIDEGIETSQIAGF